MLNGLSLTAKTNPGDAEVLVHDEKEGTGTMAFLLSRLAHPEYPVPVGVLRNVERPLFHKAVRDQVDAAKQKNPPDLGRLFNSGSTWTVD